MMRKYIIFLFTAEILFTGILLPQVTQEWVRRYPDSNGTWGCGNAITTDNLNSVYVTGLVIINDYRYCATLKYNTDGAVSWIKLYAGSNSAGKSTHAIAVDDCLNVLVTGGEFIPGNSSNFLTIKYDSSGNEKWVKRFNGAANYEDDATALVVDNSGNIYITGCTSLGGNSFVYCTIKYNTAGDEIWIRNYGVPSPSSKPFAMVVDNNCNIYITGMNNSRAATVSYDSSGNLRWSQAYPFGSWGYAIALDSNNNTFIAGITGNSLTDGNDYLTIKYSSAGTEQWTRRYTYCNEWGCDNDAQSIGVDKSGNVIVTGSVLLNPYGSGCLCTIKYTNSGDTVWIQRSCPGSGGSNTSLNIDTLNNIYISAGVHDSVCNSNSYYTIKYDSLGIVNWLMTHCGYYYYMGETRGISVDKTGNVFITGGLCKQGFYQIDMTTIKYSQPVGVKTVSNTIPGTFTLYQNYPNPFNPKTNIKFDVPKSVHPEIVRLAIYDVMGREVEVLINRQLEPGTYEVEWNATNYPSGVYFYRITAGEFTETKKMILVK